MSGRQTVWIDLSRCTGCATCVGVCPVGAIHIMSDKAHIDGEICTGCGACVDACPEGAIQFVVEGEIVSVQEWPLPAVLEPRPIAEAAGAAAVATGTVLLKKAAQALVRSLGQWLTHRSAARGPFPGHAQGTGTEASAGVEGKSGGRRGHRVRHRRRGR